MSDQCSFCGGFEKLGTCDSCAQPTCAYCIQNHRPYCEQLQKAKRRGEGPTVANMGMPAHRAGHQTPEPTPAPSRGIAIPAALGAPYDLSAVPDATGDPYEEFAKMIAFDPPQPPTPSTVFIPEWGAPPPPVPAEQQNQGPAVAPESVVDRVIHAVKDLLAGD